METNNSFNLGKQHITNEDSALNNMLSSQDVNEASNVHVLELQQEVYEISLVYNINNPTEPNVWDGEAHPLSVFRT